MLFVHSTSISLTLQSSARRHHRVACVDVRCPQCCVFRGVTDERLYTAPWRCPSRSNDPGKPLKKWINITTLDDESLWSWSVHHHDNGRDLRQEQSHTAEKYLTDTKDFAHS